jgi:hypothetical protein
VLRVGHDTAKALPLVEGVEDDVVAERDELGDVSSLYAGAQAWTSPPISSRASRASCGVLAAAPAR